MLLSNLLRAQSLKSFSFIDLNDKLDKAKHFRISRAFTVRSRTVSRYWRRLRPDGKNQSGDVALSRQCVLFVRSYIKVFRLLFQSAYPLQSTKVEPVNGAGARLLNPIHPCRNHYTPNFYFQGFASISQKIFKSSEIGGRHYRHEIGGLKILLHI